MSRRANSPDTDADRELLECITATPPRSFIVTAGAGSGKTTSLIKALERVIEKHGQGMLTKRQRVACITYTEVAANEIREDVAAKNLVHVSTIHSFYWTIASTFQADIKAWVLKDLQEHLDGLINKVFGPRVQQKTKDKNKKDQVRYKRYLEAASKTPSFRYGIASDYEKGVLGHEDILKLCNYLLQHKPLFRRVVALNFPFIFIDESQDTFPEVVESFRMLEAQMHDRFCLGFFGDPMQKIYLRGAGKIGIEERWKAITKPENFRCAQSILRVANSIRKEGDGLQQVRGLHELVDGVEQAVEGSARIFVLPNTGDRQAALSQIRAWSAAANGDDGWLKQEDSVKILVIVHRIAAKRLGWDGIYSALNDRAPTSFKQGLLDGTCWPVRQLLGFVVPLVQAMDRADEFAAMNILREHCPRLQSTGAAGGNVSTVLKEVRSAMLALKEMIRNPTATLETVVAHLRDMQLLTLDPRMERAIGLEAVVENEAADDVEAGDGEEGSGISPAADLAVAKLLQCSTAELLPYALYVAEGSPFATQHGVKGAQFDKVLVVMDEEESDYNLYDYEKVLSEKQASEDDRRAFETGNDNTWSRTLRLLYVCCTRAKRGLALAFFVSNPEATAAHIVASGIFPKDSVITQSVLDTTRQPSA
jgi:DNA helicase II / ATP-dependent DNA helicase PcrA